MLQINPNSYTLNILPQYGTNIKTAHARFIGLLLHLRCPSKVLDQIEEIGFPLLQMFELKQSICI